MRLILFIVLVMLGGYGLMQADLLLPDNYVKMYVASYVVELKLVPFAALVFLAAVTLYFLFKFLGIIFKSPRLFSKWRSKRARSKASDELGAGYLSLIKGDWKRAEAQLTAHSDHSNIPYVNYLAAARAAQEQGKLTERDNYLQRAYQAAPAERLAIGLTKAKLHERAGQISEAVATLDDVKELGAKNPQYTAMLLQAHEQNGNWAELEALLPTAKRQKALSTQDLLALETKTHLNHLLSAKDRVAAFKGLPRAQRKGLANIEVYAHALCENGETAAAEKVIRNTLKNDWSDELVHLYGKLGTEKPAKLLRRVEGWLMARPESAELNLAAGRLAKANNDFDRAKQYLQTAITQAHLPDAYAVLGEVFEANNESGKALGLYRSGMKFLAERDEMKGVNIALANSSQDINIVEQAAASDNDTTLTAVEEQTNKLIVPSPS